MHPIAVRARGLQKTFGAVVALDGVDLDVPAGQVHGLVGPNGAGKTTLLGLLLGLSVPDGGSLELLGSPMRRALALPAGVAGFLDGPGLYPALTARQNLDAVARLRGVPRTQVAPALERVGLTDVAHDRVRGFSLGMRQRLGLASALLGRPRLLVLDEPMNGLDPTAVRRVHELLAELAAGGTAVVLSSHRLSDVAAACAAVTLLSGGRARFTGPVGQLAAAAGPVEHRVVTSDPPTARELAARTPGLALTEGPARPGAPDQDVIVSGAAGAIEELVARLVRAGVGVREVTPVVAPLEAAYLALAGAA